MDNLRDSIIHGLRSQGWSKIEAENEALDRIERMRQRCQHNWQANVPCNLVDTCSKCGEQRA